jgi:DOPA 4,5-dioxygenase
MRLSAVGVWHYHACTPENQQGARCQRSGKHMNHQSASISSTHPTGLCHAHIYYDAASRHLAEAAQHTLKGIHAEIDSPIRFVGALRDLKVGPHPTPQFMIHFMADQLPRVRPVLETLGLSVLLHPLTDNDLHDHTVHAQWIGEPVALDLSELEPPGQNAGIARFGKTESALPLHGVSIQEDVHKHWRDWRFTSTP